MVRAPGAEPTSYLSVPNLLSLARLPLAAAFLLLPDTGIRIAIIIAAAASDYLDGWWARTRGPRTRLDALLDPITDKIFVLVALLAFAAEGTLNLLQLLIMLFRDLFVTTGFLGLLVIRRDRAVGLQARYPGKVVTVLQIAAVLILTVAPVLALPVVLLTAVASIWAVADYGAVGVRVLRAPRRAG
jgi:cardiolipin synthase (CMP-forming)